MKTESLSFSKMKNISLALFVVGSIVSVALGLLQPNMLIKSYLPVFLFWAGLTIGAMPMIFLHHLTSGNWGYPIRRALEIIAGMVPLIVLLFLPVLFFAPDLFPWANPAHLEHDPILIAKTAYLNVPFFGVRASIYFFIWILMAILLNRWSLSFDREPTPSLHGKLQALGGFGLILYGLTVTFSSIDWAMSLEPHWFSSIYGFLFMIGNTLAGFSFALILILSSADKKPFNRILTAERSHDLGNLLFAFILLWAYISLCQFIIIWSANLQEEVPWYLRRLEGFWKPAGLILVFFHFAVPFFLLLNRSAKRKFHILKRIALLVLAMRWLDLLWLTKPAYEHGSSFSFLDISLMAAVSGLWLFVFFWRSENAVWHFNHDPLLYEETHGSR